MINLSAFLQCGNLSTDQITFINNIIDLLTRNGVIEKRTLVQPPFTDLHHLGIFGLFDSEAQTRIVRIIERVNENAGAGYRDSICNLPKRGRM